MEVFNTFSRIRFGRIGRALVTSLALLLPPAIAVAGPPNLFLKRYPAKRSDYKKVAKACNISPRYSKKDSVFRYEEEFFYRSRGHCLNTGEKRYCATYFVDNPENPKCLGIFYTTGVLYWSEIFEDDYDVPPGSVVLITPLGHVQVYVINNLLTVREVGKLSAR